MSIDKKILEEIQRYNEITNYIFEQEVPPPPAEGDIPPPPPPAEGDVPPPPVEDGVEEIPEPVDVESDPDVEVVGDEGQEVPAEEGGDESEELDITDLVDTQKNISDKQDEYMSDMFSKLDDLNSRLESMDKIFDKINSLEQKIEKYREKTPEEKLQLRSLDSYPYSQKLTDFFMDKKDDFEKMGKEEYILNVDELENFTDSEIRNSFDEPFKEL